MIENGLFSLLSLDSGVATLTQGNTSPPTYRIFPLMIPQRVYGDATRQSCIVYTKVGAARSVRFDGTDNVVGATFQIDTYSVNYNGAIVLADAVRHALIDYHGTVGSVEIKAAMLENEFALDDPEPGLYRISQSWSIWFVED